MIKNLPHWVITDISPAFYDIDSKTCVEQTGKVYAKMRELVDDYNKFVTDINKAVKDYHDSIFKSEEEFKNEIIKIVHDYIYLIDVKISDQDAKINEALGYIKNNLDETITEVIRQMIDDGALAEVILESVSNIETNINTIEGNIAGIQSEIITIKSDANTLSASVTSLEESVANTEARITENSETMSTQFDLINDKINGFEDDVNGVLNDVSTNTTAIENIETRLDNTYPAGSIVITNTNTNPSSNFGGSWTLLKKEFKPFNFYSAEEERISEYFTPGDNISVGNFGLIVEGNTIYTRLDFTINTELADTAITIGTLNLEKMGVNGQLYLASYDKAIGSDAGDCVGVFDINASGVVTFQDIIVKGGVSTVPSGARFRIEQVLLIQQSKMLETACNCYYWVKN